MSDNCELPDFSSDAAAVIAQRLFGLDGSIKALDGERDLNFLIADREGKFVFKIANLMESPAMLECQHLVLKRLASARLFERVVLPRPSLDGNDLNMPVACCRSSRVGCWPTSSNSPPACCKILDAAWP